MSEDIKRIYEQDIREKKQIGRGARSRTGKQGHVGKMRTPADLLTGKEKRAYTQSSTISTSNLYDQIMPLEDFKSLSKQKKMLVLDAYRRCFTTKEIAAQWSLSDKTLYYYYRAYGVTRGKPSKDKEPHGSAQPAEEAAADKSLTQAGLRHLGEKEAERREYARAVVKVLEGGAVHGGKREDFRVPQLFHRGVSANS